MGHARFTRLLFSAALGLMAVMVAGGMGADARPGPSHGAAAGPGQISPAVFLYLNTIFVAQVHSIDGCGSFADVVDTRADDQALGPTLKQDACVVEHGRTTPGFETFLSRQLGGAGAGRASIQIAMGDVNTQSIRAEVQITQAVLSRLQVPAVNALSGASAYFTSTFTGASILPVDTFNVTFPKSTARPNPMLANLFSFYLGGAGMPGTKSVSALTFRRDIGEVPGPWTYSNLVVVTGFGRGAGSFPAWYADSVLGGPVTEERSAQLLLLRSTGTPLVTLDLPAVGVFRADSGLDNTARTWSMYVDAAGVTFN